MKPKAIKELQTLASEMVGDSKSPNVFFVTNQGVVVTATRDFHAAYCEWHALAYSGVKVECALEDRRFGVIACVEPDMDNSKNLVRMDFSADFLHYHITPK